MKLFSKFPKTPSMRRVRVKTHIILNNFAHLFTSNFRQQYNKIIMVGYYIQLALIFHYIFVIVFIFIAHPRLHHNQLRYGDYIKEYKFHMTLAFQIYSNFISTENHERDTHISIIE